MRLSLAAGLAIAFSLAAAIGLGAQATPPPAAPTKAGAGRGRAQQTPPPPPLTCSSKATEWDNKVPPALASQGFVSIFNGKDLSGWQALIDIGTLKFGAGLNP